MGTSALRGQHTVKAARAPENEVLEQALGCLYIDR